jgi:sphinganine C4-monooxygenase
MDFPVGTLRPPLVPFLSDKHLSLALPIIAYWFYSGLFHFLDCQSWAWLEKYRIHPPEEVTKRNRVTRWQVVRDVIVQQLGQVLLGGAIMRYEPDETILDDAAAIARLRAPPYNLPNLASAEVVYWFLMPVLRQLIAVFILDAWEYWIHRLMHVNKFLYRHLHARHHRLYVPYAFGALYNHPLEGFFLDTVGTAIAMKIANLTLREAMFFFVFATMKTVDDHCGWNFPWDPFQFLFSNNSVYHDVHHQTYGIKANFSQPFFTFCMSLLCKSLVITNGLFVGDRLSGTYMAPPSHGRPANEHIVVQALGNSATEEGSRKRRKSIASPKENGSTSPKQTAVEVHPIPSSPKSRKPAGATNGLGSRMLVVEK